MATKRQTARGAQNSDFNFRARQGAFEWGGVMPDGEPGSIPVNRLRNHINGRYRSGILRPRGGVAKLTPSALHASDASVRGLVDFQMGTRRSLYCVADGCPGIHASAGFSLNWFDLDLEPQFQSGVYYDASTQGLVIEPYSGAILIGQDNTLRLLTIIDIGYGRSALAASGSSQDEPLITFTGFSKISAMKAFDGRVCVALDAGAGASKVISWDGTTEKADGLSSINAPTGMGEFRESLILGYGGAPNHIRVRSTGTPPGSWGTVNPDAGTAAFKIGVSFRDRFYFTTLGEDLYRFDGTNLNRLAVGTTGLPAGCVTYGICVAEGFLFVAYTTAANQARIARFDGTTWTANYKDLTSQFGATVTAVRPIIPYRGGLVAAGVESGRGTLFFSPGTTFNGTWTKLLPNATSGEIDQLVAF